MTSEEKWSIPPILFIVLGAFLFPLIPVIGLIALGITLVTMIVDLVLEKKP